MSKVLKYPRGSIWWVALKGEGHVQQKTRPCIIISNNMNNLYSNVVQVIPLTTNKRDFCSHVSLGKLITKDDCYSMAEQIVTVNKNSLKSFSGILLDSQMKEIEDSILVQLGFKSVPNNIGIPNYNIDEDVEIEPDLQIDEPAEPTKLGKCDIMSQIEKFNTQYNLVSSEPVENSVKTRGPKNIKWTDDYKLSLIQDFDADPNNMDNREACIKKYELKNNHSLITYVTKFRKELVANGKL